MPLPKFVETVKACWKEVKEVKKATYKLIFEVVRGAEGCPGRGNGTCKGSEVRDRMVLSDNRKHADTMRVSCLRIWNKTLELEEAF